MSTWRALFFAEELVTANKRGGTNVDQGNALTAGWISIGNLWMFGGLLAMMKKAKGGLGNEEQETK